GCRPARNWTGASPRATNSPQRRSSTSSWRGAFRTRTTSQRSWKWRWDCAKGGTMRRVDRRFWVAAAVLAAAYTVAGFAWGKTAPLNDLYDVAGVGTFCAAILFIAVYTVQGLRGPAKW